MGLFFLGFSPGPMLASRCTRPFRLYEEGFVGPTGQFFPYADFLDAYLLPPIRTKKPTFLLLTRTDGQEVLIGAPRTKYVVFQTAEFGRVSALVVEGVRSRGHRSGVEWTAGARAMLEPASIFRGRVLVTLEALAHQAGISQIDEAFVRRAVHDPSVARGLGWRPMRKGWA